MNINEIRKELKGYHIEISLYPSGGIIDVTGCEECGTDDSESAGCSWKEKNGETIRTAVNKLKTHLEAMVYCDPLKKHGNLYGCNMASKDLDKMNAVAKKVNLKKSQMIKTPYPHYLVPFDDMPKMYPEGVQIIQPEEMEAHFLRNVAVPDYKATREAQRD